MDHDNLIAACKDELQLVLGFFARVESKSSVVLAIDTGMMGFLAANAPPFSCVSRWMWLSGCPAVLLLAASIIMLYRGSFPSLSGGQASLIYFREIAKRTEHKFVEEFSAQTEKQHANDLLGQVWRNSQILSAKFDFLKWAFALMAVAIPFWIITLALFAARNARDHSTLFRP